MSRGRAARPIAAGPAAPRRPFVAPPEPQWRGSRLPDPDDTLQLLWQADTEVGDPTGRPGAVTGRGGRTVTPHRRRARARPHPRRDVATIEIVPERPRLAVRATRALAAGVGRCTGAAAALGVAWAVLVTVRTEPRTAYRNVVVAEIDAAVVETLTVDHMLSVATWVGYVTSTVVLGGLVFERFVARAPVRMRLGTTVVVGLLAVAAAFPLRAAEVSGEGLTAVTDPEIRRLVATSAFGGALAVRAAGLLMLGATLGSRAGAGRLRRLARLVGGATLVASYLIIGHPQATDPAVLHVGALAVHVVAVATWFGGVAVLASELRPGGPDRLSDEAVARFSRLAEAMVVVVIASGLVLAEGQNVLHTEPWRTGYGLAFTIKLGFVGVVLLIGGYNKARVVPAIARHDSAAARRRLRTTCVVEATVIGMGILLMTAAMTSGGF